MNSKNLILKNIIDTEPVLGAGAPTNSQVVRFAFTSNPDSIASGADGQIVFAHIPALGSGDSTGVIYVGDQIVSSKILDASFVDADVVGDESKILCTDGSYHTAAEIEADNTLVKASKQTFTVKYVNAANAVVTASFDNVNPDLAKAFVKAQAAADAERLDRLDTSVSGIETFIKGDVVTAATGDTNAAVVEATAGTNGYKTYTVDVKVDDDTVKIGANKVISAPKSIAIESSTGADANKKYIVLKNADGDTESVINVADLIGDGIVADTSYHNDTNELVITWNTATGDSVTTIDLSELLDIDDVFVKPGSENYLTIAADTSVLNVSANIQDISTADETHTGLLDASTTKTWILDQLNETNISAEGDDYISATIDENDNKKIIIDSSVANLTYTATTTGDNPTNATLVGVANSLVDGAQAATAISNFVNDRIDASIKALDATVNSTGNINVAVQVVEADGLVSGVTVAETYATVTYTAPQTEGTPSPATLVVTEGTEGGLVTGADINKVKQYVDAQLGDADADVTVTEATNSYVSVTIAERDGVLSAANSSMSVTYAAYDNATHAATTHGIATDAYVTAAINDLDVTTSDSDSSAIDTLTLVKVVATETDGKIKMESVAVKTIDVSSASADSDGLATAKAVKDALTWTVIL